MTNLNFILDDLIGFISELFYYIYIVIMNNILFYESCIFKIKNVEKEIKKRKCFGSKIKL